VGGAVAFLSYAHVDDDESDGVVTVLHRLLLQELRLQSGDTFQLFRDRNDLQWGKAWRQTIDTTLDSAAMLIALVSPSFFASHECRRELERFLTRESQLSRQDLILPIYWIDTSIMEDEAQRQGDSLAQCIGARQYKDCRAWRFRLLSDSVSVRPDIAKLAKHMIDIVNRPLYNIRSMADESIKVAGAKLVSAAKEKPGSGQWLTDLADLSRASPMIDPDMRKQLMHQILTRRFGEF